MMHRRNTGVGGVCPDAPRPRAGGRRKGQLPGLSPVCGHRHLCLYRTAILARFSSSASPLSPVLAIPAGGLGAASAPGGRPSALCMGALRRGIGLLFSTLVGPIRGLQRKGSQRLSDPSSNLHEKTGLFCSPSRVIQRHPLIHPTLEDAMRAVTIIGTKSCAKHPWAMPLISTKS